MYKVALDNEKERFNKRQPSRSSKNRLDKYLPSIHKENICSKEQELRYPGNSSQFIRTKPKIPPLFVCQAHGIDFLKETQPIQTTVMKKLHRQWATKPTNIIKDISNTERITVRKSAHFNPNALQYAKIDTSVVKNNELMTLDRHATEKEELQSTVKLGKTKSVRQQPSEYHSRKRMNSCKVSLKNVFPDKKQALLEISQYFHREDDQLSTIPANTEQLDSDFISKESLTHIIF